MMLRFARKTLTRMTHLLVGSSLVFATTALGQVQLSEIEAGNVTPFSFSVVWKMSETASPALEVYSDEAGQQEITDQLRVEFSPLGLGERSVSSDYAARQERYALQDLVAARNIALVRVSGLRAGTSYYVRPLALEESGNVVAGQAGSLIEVKTALENSFITESKQLVFSFESGTPSQSQGAIARLQSPGLAYPLFSVVGDGAGVTEAYFNLDQLLNTEGSSNATPQGPLSLGIGLIGDSHYNAEMGYNVTYGGGYVTAAAVVVAFDTQPVLDSFAFDPIATQLVGVPFTITIRALDRSGNLLADFTEKVEVASSLAATAGLGESPAFVGGVLENHSITLSESGPATLAAQQPAGDVSGTSNNFQVEGQTIYRQLSLAASPIEGGTVSGAGQYAEGSTAAIRAEAALRYRFDRWEGAGAADASLPSTTVSMTQDRSLSAIFIKSETPAGNTYEAWEVAVFSDFSNPVDTAPGDDFDKDGLSNLLEYAFGGDPTQSTAADYFPKAERGSDGQPVFIYVRRTAATDLTYTVQLWNQASSQWVTYLPPVATTEVTAIDDIVEEVVFPIPQSVDSGLVRIMVLKN